MKWNKILSLLIVSVLLAGGLSVLGSGTVEAHENHAESVTFGVQMDRTSALHSLADGDIDMFLQSLEATIYDGMDPEIKAQLGLWESAGGYNNWLVNPAREGHGTSEMENAIDQGWIEDPDEVMYEANNADDEWEFNPFAVQDVRYSLHHLTDRQGTVEDLQDGFGEPRYIWEATGTGPYVEHFEDMVEGGTRDPENGTFGMTPYGDQEWARDYAFDALEDIADDDDALMGDLQYNGDTWEYQGPDADDYEAVEVTLAIREEDWRVDQGARFADAIEEYLDFETEEWLASRATLSPQVFSASPEPYDNLPFHIYTGGWLASAAVAYPDVSLRQMYSPAYGFVFPEVQEGHWAYAHNEAGQELNELTLPPFTGNVEDEDEYWEYMKDSLELATQEAIRVYTVTETNFFTYNEDSIERAVPNVVTGWDQIYGPRTLEPAEPGDDLHADYYSAEGELYMDNWNWYGGSEGAYGANQRRWVLGQETWNHPTSGESIEMKSEWEVEREYEFVEGELDPQMEIPETALEYNVTEAEWQTVDEYYEGDVPNAGTSATITMSEGTWHDGTEHDLQTIAEYYGRLANMVYEGEGDWYDYYYAPHADEVMPWWETVMAIEFHPEDNAYTIYGDNVHPADSEVGSYYTINPRTSQPVYEAIKQDVYETDYSANPDTTFGWDSGEAEVYVHLMGAGQAEDYYIPTMENMIDEGFVPRHVDGGDELPEELTYTEEEYADKLQAAIDFFEDHNNLFISYGPYYYHDNIPEIQEIELQQFEGYTDYNDWDHWVHAFDIQELNIFDFDHPDMIQVGEPLEITALGVIETLFPEYDTGPIEDDVDLFPFRLNLFDEDGELVAFLDDLDRDAGADDTLISGGWESTEFLEPGMHELELVVGMEDIMVDERVFGEVFVASEDPYFEVDITDHDDEIEQGDEATVEYEVENMGGEEGTQDIVFSVEGEEEDTEEVTLDVDETYEGEFTWVGDELGPHVVEVASEDTSDIATIEVVEEIPPYFEVDITDYDDEVEEGEEVTVDYEVENTGGDEDTQDIVFSVEGEEEDTEEVTLDVDETYEGSFTWECEEAGEYELEVASDDDSDSVTVEVVEEVIDPAEFEVEITAPEDGEEFDAEEDVTVEYEVENVGEEEGTQTISVEVEGTEVYDEEFTLDAGETDSGEYTIEFDDVHEDEDTDEDTDHTITVSSEDDSDSVTITMLAEEDVPGFTMALLIVGAMVAIGIYYKKEN